MRALSIGVPTIEYKALFSRGCNPLRHHPLGYGLCGRLGRSTVSIEANRKRTRECRLHRRCLNVNILPKHEASSQCNRPPVEEQSIHGVACTWGSCKFYLATIVPVARGKCRAIAYTGEADGTVSGLGELHKVLCSLPLGIEGGVGRYPALPTLKWRIARGIGTPPFKARTLLGRGSRLGEFGTLLHGNIGY